MRPFERLLVSSEAELAQTFAKFPIDRHGQVEPTLEATARQLGLNTTELVCACGFSPHIVNLPRVLNVLGFGSFDALWGHRNYLFITDVYHLLSINDVVAIYAAVARLAPRDDLFPDLVGSRLSNIEAQIEATINPIVLGSYKLEMRAIYEHRHASRELVEMRLGSNYAVLRSVSNEIDLMLEAGTVEPAEILKHPGVTPEEKARMVQHGRVLATMLKAHLEQPDLPEAEQRVLRALLKA